MDWLCDDILWSIELTVLIHLWSLGRSDRPRSTVHWRRSIKSCVNLDFAIGVVDPKPKPHRMVLSVRGWMGRLRLCLAVRYKR